MPCPLQLNYWTLFLFLYALELNHNYRAVIKIKMLLAVKNREGVFLVHILSPIEQTCTLRSDSRQFIYMTTTFWELKMHNRCPSASLWKCQHYCFHVNTQYGKHWYCTCLVCVRYLDMHSQAWKNNNNDVVHGSVVANASVKWIYFPNIIANIGDSSHTYLQRAHSFL